MFTSIYIHDYIPPFLIAYVDELKSMWYQCELTSWGCDVALLILF